MTDHIQIIDEALHGLYSHGRRKPVDKQEAEAEIKARQQARINDALYELVKEREE